MDDFYHSEDANNIVHLFYNADVMVYVEGEDDVPFWEVVFNSLAEYKVEVQEVGGSNELAKYIEELELGKLQGVIACDSDFEILKGNLRNPNIIRTYGYAIENSLICPSTILKVIRSVGKISAKNIPSQELGVWLSYFTRIMKNLVIYDVHNELNGLGISVVGDNCSKFLKSKKSHDVCEIKVNEFIANIGFSVSQNEIDTIINLIGEIPRDFSDFIRGHFLFSAVSKFISASIKQINSKVSISNDALFGSLLLAFENNFDEEHKHYNYYSDAIKNLSIAA
ncbi:DUF4435 domain-containing protein [Pseudoalteromonas sp. 20-92]|uniref:DUF4435 domain-containing protein n=1 Tax=Pseudoalteromonas sp. 20-92 TaxID=2969394 RepID=UPI0027B56338|nr:DUF4435 domain-containing protein [Pseudoalteromonas sp. 20-92]MDQ2044859.1 DUF4435 domain-containing protein [Pseudoalteromonas sp. 20-92]